MFLKTMICEHWESNCKREVSIERGNETWFPGILKKKILPMGITLKEKLCK
jgi:hypothetical protein